jgi:hypothetical protein
MATYLIASPYVHHILTKCAALEGKIFLPNPRVLFESTACVRHSFGLVKRDDHPDCLHWEKRTHAMKTIKLDCICLN